MKIVGEKSVGGFTSPISDSVDAATVFPFFLPRGLLHARARVFFSVFFRYLRGVDSARSRVVERGLPFRPSAE